MIEDIFKKPWLDVVVEFFSPEEGGNNLICLGDYLYGDRFVNGYRPHFRIKGETEYLGIMFINGPQGLIKPNEKVNAKVWLSYYPEISYEKLINGAEFEIMEGARIAGTGKVIGSMIK
ncbi:hypothetical protein [Bacillus sp. FJAT-27445]|uniref:hypothetical protein n=1 Tax=Bacillus sp. FJAT-27445 TaxID=1679166 RepID=UPI000743C4CC|nr:hypothetical protein [Bacillus sp. FJAT-27445]